MLLSERESALRRVQQNGLNLMYAEECFKDDEEIVLCAVSNTGYALKYASPRLQDNIHVVKKAMTTHRYGHVFQFASERLRDDTQLVLHYVGRLGLLYHVSTRLKDNKEVALCAVYSHGSSLGYTSDRLKDDDDLVLIAVERCGFALAYASERLKKKLHLRLISVKRPTLSLLRETMSFVSKKMEFLDEDGKEYLDIYLTDALSTVARRNPVLVEEVEKIVAFIHNPSLALFQTHTKRNFSNTSAHLQHLI